MSAVPAMFFSTLNTLGWRKITCCLAFCLLSVSSQSAPGNAVVAESDGTAGEGRCVILLHGLARTWRSMRPVGKALGAAGWQVVNNGYPSRSATVEELSGHVATAFDECRDLVASDRDIDVVTHSMGGMLLRQWAKESSTNFGRAVMLGPPNQGSELVDRIGETIPFRLVNGPAGRQLGTDAEAIWRRLPAVGFELGVIAGRGEEGGYLGRHVASPNDGKVSVESTRVDGMKDHLVLDVGHTFMMNDAIVHKQIKSFLLEGRFESKTPSADTP